MNNKIKIVYGGAIVVVIIIAIVFMNVNKKCEVIINAKGGTIYPTQSVKCGEKMEKIANPVLEGYTFIEWYDEETNEKFDLNTPITKNMKIAARYEQTKNTTE